MLLHRRRFSNRSGEQKTSASLKRSCSMINCITRKELRDLAEQLRLHLNSSTSSSTPSPSALTSSDKGVEENAAKVSVEGGKRKKRQAPDLPPPPPPPSLEQAAPSAALPAPATNVANITNNSTVVGSSAVQAATNMSTTSTTTATTTTISPLLLLVDETSNVLDMLEKTDKQIIEAANSSASSTPGDLKCIIFRKKNPL